MEGLGNEGNGKHAVVYMTDGNRREWEVWELQDKGRARVKVWLSWRAGLEN